MIEGRSPTMRPCSCFQNFVVCVGGQRSTELRLIGLDSIESFWTQKNQIKYIDTKNQLADILTKANFTRDEWNHLLSFFNISHFSSTVCSSAMAKRLQQESGEERVTAKSKPMMNLEEMLRKSRSLEICCCR